MAVYFIAGIDTEIGKTVVTGHIAKYLSTLGRTVTTQKLVQTGSENISDDIVKHREIMGTELNSFDKDGITCPYLFKFPASPHLASNMEEVTIEPDVIDRSTETLKAAFDDVLIEGVGGIKVPLTNTYTTLDFLEERKYPVILVTSPKLGSINHTLLSLEVLKTRKIPLHGLIYNWYPDEKKEIGVESIKYFKAFLEKEFHSSKICQQEKSSSNTTNVQDFSDIFG
jgi:dethiobiotin synthetase